MSVIFEIHLKPIQTILKPWVESVLNCTFQKVIYRFKIEDSCAIYTAEDAAIEKALE